MVSALLLSKTNQKPGCKFIHFKLKGHESHTSVFVPLVEDWEK